jgi:hypothetical protein
MILLHLLEFVLGNIDTWPSTILNRQLVDAVTRLVSRHFLQPVLRILLRLAAAVVVPILFLLLPQNNLQIR